MAKKVFLPSATSRSEKSSGDDATVPIPGTEAGWASMSWKDAQCLPLEQKKYFLKYGYSVDFDGNMMGPLGPEYVDTSSYINHSCNPNVWNSETGDSFMARRSIKAANILYP